MQSTATTLASGASGLIDGGLTTDSSSTKLKKSAAALGTRTFVEEDLGDDHNLGGDGSRADSENPLGGAANGDKKKKKRKNKNKKKAAVNSNEASGPSNAANLFDKFNGGGANGGSGKQDYSTSP